VLLPNQRKDPLCVLWLKMGNTSPRSGENLQKNNKLLLAGNAAKHTEKLRKFLFFNSREINKAS
jgi:hypothetical protein